MSAMPKNEYELNKTVRKQGKHKKHITVLDMIWGLIVRRCVTIRGKDTSPSIWQHWRAFNNTANQPLRLTPSLK